MGAHTGLSKQDRLDGLLWAKVLYLVALLVPAPAALLTVPAGPEQGEIILTKGKKGPVSSAQVATIGLADDPFAPGMG